MDVLRFAECVRTCSYVHVNGIRMFSWQYQVCDALTISIEVNSSTGQKWCERLCSVEWRVQIDCLRLVPALDGGRTLVNIN